MSGSIVLAADDPAALARFYGALLDVEPQPGRSGTHWWLEVYAPSRSRPQPRQQGRLALCLQRETGGSRALGVLNDWITTALALGAFLQDPPRQVRSLAAGSGGQPPAAVGAALKVGRG